MGLEYSEEQEELRSVVRQFLSRSSTEAEVRRLMASDEGYDPGVWEQMANQLGLQALIVPTEHGGQGFGYQELMIVLEEMGRCLLCAPFFSTVVLGVNTLLRSGDRRACDDLLPAIATGESIATLAHVEERGSWDPGEGAASATPGEDGWTITGEKWFVLDGHVADLILVTARTAVGMSLFAVQRGAAGLTTRLLQTMDETRKQAVVTLADTPARLVGEEGQGVEIVRDVLDLAAVALAAEQVGGAAVTLDMAVEYAKVRMQFGRPIGSFQAIKHKCADMLLETESARSAALYAGHCAATASDELPVVACLAKAYCSEAYFHNAAENIQVHGGIGFTWEHPAHLYFKRAKSSELLFGDPSYHRGLMADRLGV